MYIVVVNCLLAWPDYRIPSAFFSGCCVAGFIKLVFIRSIVLEQSPIKKVCSVAQLARTRPCLLFSLDLSSGVQHDRWWPILNCSNWPFNKKYNLRL